MQINKLFAFLFNLVLDKTKYWIYYYGYKEVITTDTQYKKGVLQLLILLMIAEKDMYGYELVEAVSKVIDVNEGTIYPILKRLTNEKYFETYLKESTEGPIRKYYHITSIGLMAKEQQLKEWKNFSNKINKYIRRSEKHE